jgi:hypothetical protein
MFVFFPRTAGAGLISADFSHSVRSFIACCGEIEPPLRFNPFSYPGLLEKFKKKRVPFPLGRVDGQVKKGKGLPHGGKSA